MQFFEEKNGQIHPSKKISTYFNIVKTLQIVVAFKKWLQLYVLWIKSGRIRKMAVKRRGRDWEVPLY